MKKQFYIALFLMTHAFTTLVYAESKQQYSALDGLSFRALMVDPKQVDLHWKDDSGQAFRYFSNLKKQLNKEKKTVIALMNAGIYGKNHIPAGLHIENGQILQQVNVNNGKGNFHIKPNGIFLIDNYGQSSVITTKQFLKQYSGGKQTQSIRIATQSGPMLVINGQLNRRLLPNSQSLYTRNGVCTTKDNKTLFIATNGVKSNFYQFAKASQQFGCHNTLYLDGSITKLHVVGSNSAFHFSPFVGILSVSESK